MENQVYARSKDKRIWKKHFIYTVVMRKLKYRGNSKVINTEKECLHFTEDSNYKYAHKDKY